MKELSKIQKNRGMTYVEIIVVLSIFAVMSAIVMFNYGDFQAKVDIKNLASDIALKIAEAQNSSLSGRLPPRDVPNLSTWKPSYGVYFDLSLDKKSFIYFTDLDKNGDIDNPDACPSDTTEGTTECLEEILITKNNEIDSIVVCSDMDCSSPSDPIEAPFVIYFVRPDSSANFNVQDMTGPKYVKITVKSPRGATADIKVYPSGRVQVN